MLILRLSKRKLATQTGTNSERMGLSLAFKAKNIGPDFWIDSMLKNQP
jgi:hypothetical protein